MDEGYESLLRAKRESELQRKQKYKADSKERLKKIARKKIQTTMVGALATIEQHLAFLWEDNKHLREVYNIVRQEILDRGNDQIRNLDNELEMYDVEWKRYHLTLPVKEGNQDYD